MSTMQPIERQLRTGYPLLRLTTLEEEGAAAAVVSAARAVYGRMTRVYHWDMAFGLEPAEAGAEVAELTDLIEMVAVAEGPAVFVVRDAYHEFDDPVILRRLRRLPDAIAERPVRLVLLTPPGELPIELAHELPSLDFTIPSAELLSEIVEQELGGPSGDVTVKTLGEALRGLTVSEGKLMLRGARADGAEGMVLLERLFASKASRALTNSLVYVPPETTLEDIGGLGGLKAWIRTRCDASGAPRGILLTGVSGCGKSYAIKALSHAMKLPLFRLDMARVFARPQPESAYAASIAAVETVAPCVLWLDEIENALALGAQDSGPASRIAGSFLTWLQERPSGIFVGATSNRVELLPAELLRRGRFDQILFVDLPDDEERKGIWAVHLRKRAVDPARFDLIVLAKSTASWSGAEIESAVDSAVVEATVSGRKIERDDLFRAIGQTVPLSVTMREQIKRVREWAHKRAILASGKRW